MLGPENAIALNLALSETKFWAGELSAIHIIICQIFSLILLVLAETVSLFWS